MCVCVSVCVCARMCVGQPEYDVAMASDVVTKACHFANAGKAAASVHLQPVISSFFAGANKSCQDLSAQGKLNLEHLAPLKPGQQHRDTSTCTSNLSCARVEGAVSGGRDVQGVLGATCVHGFPVRGSFVDVEAKEHFSVYLEQLKTVILEAGGKVKHVYIDFACQLGVTWKRYLEQQKLTDTEMYTQVQLLVNFLHAGGHILACQLKFSGRHTKGAAWHVGEQTEQLWALLKVREPHTHTHTYTSFTMHTSCTGHWQAVASWGC